jgi:hypothetical protein
MPTAVEYCVHNDLNFYLQPQGTLLLLTDQNGTAGVLASAATAQPRLGSMVSQGSVALLTATLFSPAPPTVAGAVGAMGLSPTDTASMAGAAARWLGGVEGLTLSPSPPVFTDMPAIQTTDGQVVDIPGFSPVAFQAGNLQQRNFGNVSAYLWTGLMTLSATCVPAINEPLSLVLAQGGALSPAIVPKPSGAMAISSGCGACGACGICGGCALCGGANFAVAAAAGVAVVALVAASSSAFASL